MKRNGKGLRTVTFREYKERIEEFDRAIEGKYPTRSEALRAFMRETVEKAEAKP